MQDNVIEFKSITSRGCNKSTPNRSLKKVTSYLEKKNYSVIYF